MNTNNPMGKQRFSLWKLLKRPSRFLYAIGLGLVYGSLVLLLNTPPPGENRGSPASRPSLGEKDSRLMDTIQCTITLCLAGNRAEFDGRINDARAVSRTV